MEEWRDIKNYEDLYQVSDTGKIRSLYVKTRILKQHNSICKQNVYMNVKLCRGGICKTFYVHRLIATAFLDSIKNKIHVNHKDGNKLNNNLDNLEWVTRSENQKHSYKMGFQNIKGNKNPFSILTEDIVKNIRENKFGLTIKEFAGLLDVSISTIYAVINRDSWKHI